MRATGYIGMTLAVLGLLLCLTGYGLALAFLLLVPAIILCHRAARSYRAESNKTHGGLIVLLVLSYIGSGLGIAVWVVALGFIIYQNRQNAVHTSSYAVTTKDQAAAAPIDDEAPRKAYARIYNLPGGDMSPADYTKLQAIFPFFGKLNECTAKLYGELSNIKQERETLATNMQSPLFDADEAFIKARLQVIAIDDASLRQAVTKLLDAREAPFVCWKQARIALESNDAAQFQAALASLDTARKNENSIEQPYVKSYAAEFGNAGQNGLNNEVETRMKDYRDAGKASTGER